MKRFLLAFVAGAALLPWGQLEAEQESASPAAAPADGGDVAPGAGTTLNPSIVANAPEGGGWGRTAPPWQEG